MIASTDRGVENLKRLVATAEMQRTSHDFNSIRALFLGAFYQGKPPLRSWKPDVISLQEQLKVADLQKKKNELDPKENNLELLAVGYLGLTRIYLEAAVTAFKEGQLDKLELASAYIDYQNIFAALYYLQRVPYTIHLAVVDWLGEYVHDSARYYQASGEGEKALAILNDGVRDLEAWIEEIRSSDEELAWYDDELAGVFSSLSVIYARRGRLQGELEDVITGFNYAEISHQMVANPGRKKDLAKMLLVESTKNVSVTKLVTTVKGLFLGATGLLGR